MPGEDIQSWSVTAANNANADSAINWAEGQPRASVNNSSRSEMAAHAKNRNLQNGSIVTGGSANAQTFTSGVGYTAPIPTGLRVLLKIGPALTSTAAATLEMDGLGAVAIKNQLGADLTAGAIVAGSYVEFLYDGTNWRLLELMSSIVSQTFTASGTYTPTSGMTFCIVEAVGGGAGGGGVVCDAAYALWAGGGGAGGYSRKVTTAALVGASQVVTIGAGGAGGAFGAGSNGGDTSLGSICIAKGGSGGAGTSAAAFGQAGAGGIAGTGDIAAVGAPGFPGFYMFFTTTTPFIAGQGQGGSSFYGGGGFGGQAAATTAANGAAGTVYGSGGGGGCSNQQAATNVTGGAGSAGLVVITEFINL